MATADIQLGTVILPRGESPKAISRLTEFEWFHKVDSQDDRVTPEVDDILLRAQQSFQAIDDIVKGMGIPPIVGIMEILFKGTVIKKKDYEMGEVEEMVAQIEAEMPGVIDRSAKLLKDIESAKSSIEEYKTIKETLEMVRKMSVNLSGFGLTRYFFTGLFVIDSQDFDEISRSLDGAALTKYELEDKNKSALVVIAVAADSEKVLKVLRNFNSNPFRIPDGFPQVPSQAYDQVESKIKELGTNEAAMTKELAGLAKKLRRDILALHEKAGVAKDVLETLRKPGGTKNFALIQGFIPKRMGPKFTDLTKKWMSVVEDVTDPEQKNRFRHSLTTSGLSGHSKSLPRVRGFQSTGNRIPPR